MASNLHSDRQRQALRDLVQLCAERSRAETDAAEKQAARAAATQRRFQDAEAAIQSQFIADLNTAQKEHRDTTHAVVQHIKQEHGPLAMEYLNAKHKTEELCSKDEERAKAELEEAQWTSAAVLEAAKTNAKEALAAVQRAVGAAMQQVEAVQLAADELIANWDVPQQPEQDEPAAAAPTNDSLQAVQHCARAAKEQLALLEKVKQPRSLKRRVGALASAAWLVLLIPAFLVGPWYEWVAGTTVLVAAATFGIKLWLTATANATAGKLYRALQKFTAAAPAYQAKCLSKAASAYTEQMAAAKKHQDEAQVAAQRNHRATLQAIAQRRERELRAAEEKYPPKLEELAKQRERALHQVEAKLRDATAQITRRRDEGLTQAGERRAQLLAANKRLHEEEWQQLAARWESGLTSFLATVREIEEDCGRLFPAWSSVAWETRAQPVSVPAGIRFGEIRVGLNRIPNGVPGDPRLGKIAIDNLPQSALLGFPERAALLFKASGPGRTAAVQALRAVMLRCLTAIPPGQARFIIIDPVGLGENFAAFGHLADYGDALVSGRIWTEPADIEQRLADVTAHIENVNQQFLRNQFASLAEYNEQAGEIVEPHRFVVVANFPAHFSAEAARRLVGIASSGGRCGVHTLISVDVNQPPPQHFQLAALERACTTLVWNDGHFAWNDGDYSGFSLQLEAPPPEETATALLRTVGEQARRASRVEVPFSLLAPPPEQRWTGNSQSAIRVPVGRAAAMKNHYLQLGEGTSQHVLIAGKTGSGKSTLLHALIAQLALYYSPDEIELYLVDFKKGVEFKTYAVHQLPHARVIAVESEREFGLSVLQRLDAELKLRGERFRALGVNDLSSYRQQVGKPLSRILLIVDEFQEFFVEDDRIAQEAALLLDRLVRQGRAFGVHILLGSQTLGGAYSLARSTIDQMAVRIALQCSETDGHLILSKENGAAQLLSRPGEAIYNDANGRVEGNHLIQTVWLADSQREQALTDVRTLARERGYVPVSPQIVFEGMAPAQLANNLLLSRLLDNPAQSPSEEWVAWLGEAIAIKDPTSAVFRRRSGANLVLIGQNAEAAAHLLTSALISLAAQQPRGEAETGENGMRFHVVGGLTADGAQEKSPEMLEGLPLAIRWGGARELPAIVGDLAQNVERSQKGGGATSAAPQFLFINGLQRFRDLRKQEDDFGFSRRGEEKAANPAKQFATVLREGPPAGVFTVVWCDTLTNLQRVVDRQALREFEMRVLFQMSAADSSNLIDSPLASKVGPYRAYYYTEDQGRLEKFRPYGAVTKEWMEVFRRSLAAGAS